MLATDPTRDLLRSSAGCVKPHLPEIGLKPCGDGKIRGERGDTPLSSASGKLVVECGFGLVGEALVVGSGIHLQPLAVRVPVEPGSGISHPLRGDHRVTDNTGRECHLEV